MITQAIIQIHRRLRRPLRMHPKIHVEKNSLGVLNHSYIISELLKQKVVFDFLQNRSPTPGHSQWKHGFMAQTGLTVCFRYWHRHSLRIQVGDAFQNFSHCPYGIWYTAPWLVLLRFFSQMSDSPVEVALAWKQSLPSGHNLKHASDESCRAASAWTKPLR